MAASHEIYSEFTISKDFHMAEPTAPNASEAGMPMFYTAPRPLDRARDGNMKLSRPTHFNFAAKTNAIPLLVDEFPMAAAYYPIVFADGPMPVPAAVVGLKNDTNLFLDKEGRWLNGAYLPAYVRRYPFILMDDPEQKQFVLCIDENSDMLSESGEFTLFDRRPAQRLYQKRDGILRRPAPARRCDR